MKRANIFYEEKKFLDGRRLLLEKEATVQLYKNHYEYAFAYMELLLGLGKGFLLDGLAVRALTYYKKAEEVYIYFKNKHNEIPTLLDVMGLKEANANAIDWQAEHLFHFSRMGIFASAVEKRDDTLILQYAIPSLLSKIEITLKNKTQNKLDLLEDIIDSTSIFTRYGFLKQVDHLLGVAFYNLTKESEKGHVTDEKHFNILQHKLIMKYCWLGLQILQNSFKVIDIKGKDMFGLKPDKTEMLKLQVYYEWDIFRLALLSTVFNSWP